MDNKTRAAIDLEKAVLVALLYDGSQAPLVQQTISGGSFTVQFHRDVYNAIIAANAEGAPTDAVSIGERLGNISAVVELMRDNIGSPERIGYYAERLAEHARQRSLRRTLTSHLARIESGEELDVGDIVSRLEELAAGPVQSITFADALSAGMKMIEDGKQLDARGRLEFGLPEVDEYLPRLAGRGVLVVVAARPSVGKTALINQLQLRCAKKGFTVGALHLEMSAEEVALRSISSEYHLNTYALANGEDAVIEELTEKVQERNISSLPILIDDRTYALSHIIARITEWKARSAVDLVIIDHLQLVATSNSERKVDALGEITRALKLTAKRLHVPIVLCSQLARANERENRKPRLSDLRDSGAIEQDSDIVIALHSEALETDEDGNRTVNIGVLKNRGGRTGWCRHEYIFNGRYQTFSEGNLQQPAGREGGAGSEEGEAARRAAAARARFTRANGRASRDVWSAAHVSEDRGGC